MATGDRHSEADAPELIVDADAQAHREARNTLRQFDSVPNGLNTGLNRIDTVATLACRCGVKDRRPLFGKERANERFEARQVGFLIPNPVISSNQSGDYRSLSWVTYPRDTKTGRPSNCSF